MHVRIFWITLVILQGPCLNCCCNMAFHQMIQGVSCAVCLNQHTATDFICWLQCDQCLDCVENYTLAQLHWIEGKVSLRNQTCFILMGCIKQWLHISTTICCEFYFAYVTWCCRKSYCLIEPPILLHNLVHSMLTDLREVNSSGDVG